MSRTYNRFMKLVRRVHLYLGLMLFPWLLLYGISGVLYNHPQIGRDISGQRLSPDRVASLTTFRSWDPNAIARDLVGVVNNGGDRFRLDPSSSAQYRGWALMGSPASDGGKHVVIVDLASGGAIVAQHGAPKSSTTAPFYTPRIELPGYSTAELAAQISPVLPGLGIDAPALRAHPKATPQLKFRVLDEDGTPWNVLYDLGTQTLDGRRADEASPMLFVELLERFHQQHHFPGNFGPMFWWAVLADLTGLTMALWALTGLLMWWQMKRLRVVGTICVAAAVLIAISVMGATRTELQWVAEPSSGPGG
jgi:hypothetical protein